jgi:PEP-CTERM motif
LRQRTSTGFGPDYTANLTTHPVLFTIDFTPTSTGPYQINTTSGITVITNDATYDNQSAVAPLDFTVVSAAPVPEPSSTAILAVFGVAFFLAYGWTRRREHRRQVA